MVAAAPKSSELKKLLYIEDDEDFQKIAKIALESLGRFDLRMSSSGLAGLEEARQWQPELILLDVMMPDIDGPETLRRLRGDPETSAIPVVFVTARVQPDEQAEYLALGAVGVIAKPFDPLKLAEQVRSIYAQI